MADQRQSTVDAMRDSMRQKTDAREYDVDLGPVENRLTGFAWFLDNCLRSRKAWTETSPRFLEAMRDDINEAVDEIIALRSAQPTDTRGAG